MIVTQKFVYVHMPKTGGTFVTTMLKRLYGVMDKPAFSQRVYRKLTGRRPFRDMHKHGFCYQIPPEYSHLPVVGCVRNPYDRYASQYEFVWWRTYPETYPGLMEHPSYPDLSFEEFVRLGNEKWLNRLTPELDVDRSLGLHTCGFITYYCKNPQALLCSGKSQRLTAEQVRESLCPDTFLRTHRLNQDLYDFLRKMGFSDSKLAFILESPKVMPPKGGRSAEKTWDRYYTPELKAFVRERERLLFELFPEFDV